MLFQKDEADDWVLKIHYCIPGVYCWDTFIWHWGVQLFLEMKNKLEGIMPTDHPQIEIWPSTVVSIDLWVYKYGECSFLNVSARQELD